MYVEPPLLAIPSHAHPPYPSRTLPPPMDVAVAMAAWRPSSASIFNTPSTSQINLIPHGDRSSMTTSLDPLTQLAESAAEETCHHTTVAHYN